MGVRKCPKCGSVWYTALVKCAFCGVEGEEVKGPISPAKLNLVHGGVSTAPPKPAEAPPPPPAADPAPPPPAEVKEAEPPAPTPVEEERPAPLPEPPAAPPHFENPLKNLPTTVVAEPPKPSTLHPSAPPRKLPPRLVPETEATTPAPMIPSPTVPLVFGLLGLVASLMLPTIGLVQKDRVLVILALLGWAILAPFAPFAWFAGQRYLDQCRTLGFAPASSARTGKLLGRLASFLLVFEFSALSIFVAIQALSGKIVCPLWK